MPLASQAAQVAQPLGDAFARLSAILADTLPADLADAAALLEDYESALAWGALSPVALVG